MKLDDKIRDRKIAYAFRKQPAIAFELALLYFVLGKRRSAKEKIADAGRRSICWLEQSGIEIPYYLNSLSPSGQLDEIEKLLVENRAIIEKRAFLKQLGPLGQLAEIRAILAKVDAGISLA